MNPKRVWIDGVEYVQSGATARFLTNFAENKRHIYQRAIELYGDPDFFITSQAQGRGNEDYGGALFYSGSKRDLSGFWNLFDRVDRDINHKACCCCRCR